MNFSFLYHIFILYTEYDFTFLLHASDVFECLVYESVFKKAYL